MPYMIFDSRLACSVSLLQTSPFQISIAWNRNPGPSSTTTTTRMAQTKKICWYLDNNRGNYLGDNNSRSSTSGSCRGYLTPTWLPYTYVATQFQPILVVWIQSVIVKSVTITLLSIFVFFFSDTCFILSFLLSLSEDHFAYFYRNEMRQKIVSLRKISVFEKICKDIIKMVNRSQL